jgi:FkbM family methyltransferase
MTVFSFDVGAVTSSLLRYGEWAENELSFLRRFAPEGAVVVDTGAYIGSHTLAFSSYVGPSGRVVSIEPQPEAFSLLKRNIEVNERGNVDIRNAVATARPGNVIIPTLRIEVEGSYGSSSLVETITRQSRVSTCEGPSNGGFEASVPAITIDSLDLEQCALLKIDTEGMEELVLQGAISTIMRCSPIVYAECNSLEGGLKTFTLLKSVDYHIIAHVVMAFNENNFRAEQDNIFGNASEVALVGVSKSRRPALRDLGLVDANC